MKANWRYIVFILLLLLGWIIFMVGLGQQYHWMETYYHADKNPFGAFVLDQLLENSWFSSYEKSNQTAFELADRHKGSMFILSSSYDPSESEYGKLMTWVEEGNHVLICTHRLDTSFAKSLGLEIDYLIEDFNFDRLWSKDTVSISMNGDLEEAMPAGSMPEEIAPAYFRKIDRQITRVLATNNYNQPVAVAIGAGEGLLMVCSVPLVFTNYGLLKTGSQDFVSYLFSILGDEPIVWTEYYELGRSESPSPLRYIMSDRALRTAFGILVLGICLLLVFNPKRRQRAIPPLIPLRNTSLDFVKTIGDLYYRQGDHKDLALKKILFFTDYLKQHFYIDSNARVTDIIRKLSDKTGMDDYEIKILFDDIQNINNSEYISKRELVTVNARIDNIYRKIEESYKK